jgi:hypothetical protein
MAYPTFSSTAQLASLSSYLTDWYCSIIGFSFSFKIKKYCDKIRFDLVFGLILSHKTVAQ